MDDSRYLSELFEEHMNPGLARIYRFLGVNQVEYTGRGAVLTDERGQEFLDLAGGYGVFFHGYRHPRIVAAAHLALDTLPISSRILLSRPQIELAEVLADIAPGDLQYSFFCNSGAESVEASIKFARIATGRTRIVSTLGAFHGKTLGALSVSGRLLYQDPFKPLVPDVVHVPYGDVAAMEAAVDEKTAAMIVEPIQGEGGVVVPPEGYLEAVRDRTQAMGALMIVDEVQTGMGRTGDWFAIQKSHVVPDLICVAKALGGGVVPMAAVIGRRTAWEFFEDSPLIHTSTFGGNPLGCMVAKEAIQVTRDEDLLAHAERKGQQILDFLRMMQKKYPDVLVEARGQGLLMGMEFASAGLAGALISELMQRQVLAVYTLNNDRVIRIMPSALITASQIDQGMEQIQGALATMNAMKEDLL